MRILFDKNVPYPLLGYLAEYDVCTAEEQGWAKLINGDLLRIAEDSGFDVGHQRIRTSNTSKI